jgi:hypothetical protein
MSGRISTITLISASISLSGFGFVLRSADA